MNSRSVSNPTIRSKVRASELVAAATFFQLCVVALDAQIPLGLPNLSLDTGTVVGGVTAQFVAQRRELRVVKPAVGLGAPTAGRNIQPRDGRSQRRGQVAPDLRLAVFDPFRQGHRGHRRRGPE